MSNGGSAARSALALLAAFVLFTATFWVIGGVFRLIEGDDFELTLPLAFIVVVGCFAAIRRLRGARFGNAIAAACVVFYGAIFFLNGSSGSFYFFFGIVLMATGVGALVRIGRSASTSRAGRRVGGPGEPKGGLKGIVRRLKEQDGLASFWLQDQTGEQVPVEAYARKVRLMEGDTVWVKGGRSSDGILRTTEVRNLTAEMPGTTASVGQADAGWLKTEAPKKEVEKAPKSGELEMIEGTARMVSPRTEEKRKKNLFESWAMVGEKTAMVLRFRLEINDRDGNIVEVVPVEIWGKEIRGDVAEGDAVQVEGKRQHGILEAKSIFNKTTKSDIEAR